MGAPSELVGDQLEAALEASGQTRRRYDRIAPIYDAVEWAMERRVRHWRENLWARLPAGLTLEAGVGTGRNLPYYPAGRDVVGLDISPRMLERARRKPGRSGSRVVLELGDVQRLPHADGTFDAAVATFLFCSVPDPELGLRELRRVLKPGGRLLLLEHVLSERHFVRPLMRALDPIPFHLWGAHIDRETVARVRAAGFVDLDVHDLFLDVVKRIEARNTPEGSHAG